MNKNIAIVGSCPSSRLLADPSEWTIWTCSPDNVGKLPHIDAWFELHADFGWPNPPAWEGNYLQWLREQPFELHVNEYIQYLFPQREVAIFPHENLIKKYGYYWFTSSVAWMMAHAIENGANQIGLFGCDMAAKSEYHTQKPGVHRWMELAHSNNIPVYVPPESDLLQPPPLYGYSYATPMGRKFSVRERELKDRILQAQVKKTQMMREMDQEIFHLQGALDQLDYAINTWTNERK